MKNGFMDLNENPHTQSLEISKAVTIFYSLLLSSAMLIAFTIFLFLLAMLMGRISIIPYVADGSVYGCQPKDITIETAQKLRINK